MWRSIATIAATVTVLSFGAAAPASAFQEIPVPPPTAPGEPPPPALALGNPAVPAEAPKTDEMEVFGYSMPKLDFGLELLYGEEQQRLELQGPPQPALESDSDISVLGKIKRRF